MSGQDNRMAQANAIEMINRAIADAMAEDDKVVVLGEDVADREEGGIVGVTRGLSARFGEHRVRSTPISEQAIVGAAIGAAMSGFRPVAEIMLMNFSAVAMDMIVNHAAKLRFMSGGKTAVPLVIRCMTGAGMQTGGQHSDYWEAWFAHVAGLKVVAPSCPADAYGLMRACIDDPDPCIFIENMPSYWTKGDAAPSGLRVPLGKAWTVREGADLTLVTYSRMVTEACAAVDQLAQEGISVELIDLRTVSPWDKETVLNSVRRTGRAMVVHEAVTPFGPGAEIASVIMESAWGCLKAPVARVGSAFSPVPFAKTLEDAYLPAREDICGAARRILNRNA